MTLDVVVATIVIAVVDDMVVIVTVVADVVVVFAVAVTVLCDCDVVAVLVDVHIFRRKIVYFAGTGDNSWQKN